MTTFHAYISIESLLSGVFALSSHVNNCKASYDSQTLLSGEGRYSLGTKRM